MKQNSAKAPLLLLSLGIALALVLAFTNVGRPALSSASETATPGATAATSQEDAAGATLVLQRCGTCHSVNRLANHPQDTNGWAQTVAQMEQMGAQVAPQEEPVLIQYLASHYGPKQ